MDALPGDVCVAVEEGTHESSEYDLFPGLREGAVGVVYRLAKPVSKQDAVRAVAAMLAGGRSLVDVFADSLEGVGSAQIVEAVEE